MIALALVLTGLLGLVLAPLFQRWSSHGLRAGLSISGILLIGLGLLLSLLTGTLRDPASVIGLAVLAWSALVFVVVLIRRSRATPPPPAAPVHHCQSRLTRGTPKTVSGSMNSTFSGLTYLFSTTATDSSLIEEAWAVGDDWIVIWAYFYEVRFTRTINIECEVRNAQCIIADPVDIDGDPEQKDRSLRVTMAEDIEYFGPRLIIVVTMGAALAASDVRFTGRAMRGGVSGQINIRFPSASKASPSCGLGTFVWDCFAEDGTSSSSSSAPTGSSAASPETAVGYRFDDDEPAGEVSCFRTEEDLWRFVEDQPPIEGMRFWRVEGELVDDHGGPDGLTIDVENCEEIFPP